MESQENYNYYKTIQITKLMTKPKQYRLLKDTPICKEGSIFALSEYGDYACTDKNSMVAVIYSAHIVESSPEWFEEVGGKWKPYRGGIVYIADPLHPDKPMERLWVGDDYQQRLYDDGIVKETREEAIKCAQDIIEFLRGGSTT